MSGHLRLFVINGVFTLNNFVNEQIFYIFREIEAEGYCNPGRTMQTMPLVTQSQATLPPGRCTAAMECSLALSLTLGDNCQSFPEK